MLTNYIILLAVKLSLFPKRLKNTGESKYITVT